MILVSPGYGVYVMVKYIGKLSRKKVNELYGAARAGIVIYQPAENHYESQPIKMFEYMAAGLPVVASDFPLWKYILEEAGCGICVNPTNAAEVKAACETLLFNPERSQEMGIRGRNAVLKQYTWDTQAEELLRLYKSIE